jgi:hypothetical protein
MGMAMRKTPIPEVTIFGDSAPRENPLASLAYRLSVWSLVPVLGLILGILALIMGAIAWRRYLANPDIEGRSQAVAAVLLGTVSAVFQASGLYCLARGLGWLDY